MGGRPLVRSARPAILSNELIQRQHSGRLRERPFRTLAMRNDFPTFECLGITKSWEGEVWRRSTAEGRGRGNHIKLTFRPDRRQGYLQLDIVQLCETLMIMLSH